VKQAEPLSVLAALFSLEKASKHASWIVLNINNALLHRNDRIVSDFDVLWANLSTALCDVTHSNSVLFLCCALTVFQHIQWVHIKFCNTDKESWASK
jgi:hypothetical protein